MTVQTFLNVWLLVSQVNHCTTIEESSICLVAMAFHIYNFSVGETEWILMVLRQLFVTCAVNSFDVLWVGRLSCRQAKVPGAHNSCDRYGAARAARAAMTYPQLNWQ